MLTMQMEAQTEEVIEEIFIPAVGAIATPAKQTASRA
jgi:hypothetical protein